MTPPIHRRLARRDDLPAVSVVLGRAFHDDPAYRFMIPDPARRARVLPGLIRTLVTVLHGGMGPLEVAEVDGHLVAAAAWNDPGAVGAGLLRTVRAAPALLVVARTRIAAFQELGDAMESLRPAEPHRYLFHLGVDPGWWGRGVGSALLRPVLADADARGELVHLECRVENIGYYRRFGFDVTARVPLDAVGMVAMSRPAA